MQPHTVAPSRGGGMIAPISNQSIAFQKTQVTHGIREVRQPVYNFNNVYSVHAPTKN